MASTQPDYKLLYEQSQAQLQAALLTIAEQNKVIVLLREQIDQLHEHIATLNKVIATQQQTIAEQQKQLQRIPVLEHELQQLRRMIFGKSTERFIPEPDNNPPAPGGQLSLAMTAEQVEACKLTEAQKIAYTRPAVEKKAHPNREAISDKLPTKITVLEPEHVPAGAVQVGIEKSRQLHYKSPELWVEETQRPVYLTSTEDGLNSRMLIAPLPAQPIDKCMAGASLLAHLVTEKYEYHLPVKRQQRRLAALGVQLPYSTLVDWVNRVADLLEPLYQVLQQDVLQSGYIHADETPLTVIDQEKPSNNKSALGYLWGFHNSIYKLVFFTYRPGRAAKHVRDLLEGYTGYLQTDGYASYDQYGQQPGVVHLQCMAHARRKFDEALQYDRKRASYALEQFFGVLYDIEREGKPMDFDKRKQLRQQKAIPVLAAFKEWLIKEHPHTLPKSPIGKAITYTLSRINQLCLYTENGMLSIDNNPVERSIRPVAMGRNNYLFCGSHDAAQRTAIIYSLLGTCKLHNIHPYEWLHDVLKRLPTCMQKNIKELLPHHWKPLQVDNNLA